MGNSLDELASYVRPLCEQFLAICKERGLDIRVVDTGRTAAEQEQKIAQGVSWVSRSQHEPQPPEMKSHAFDVVPVDYMSMKGWNPAGPLWAELGEIGESLGLRWGGRWTNHRDPGHFEFRHSAEATPAPLPQTPEP